MRSSDARALLTWYDAHARDLAWRVGPAARAAGVVPDPYRVWLSEIMLQQTTVATVVDYYRRFIARWPDVAALAAAPLDEVLAQWAGLGYYARARNLHACAHAVVARHGGRFPTRYDELLALPGVGPYTAAAIAAIAFDLRVPVIDGNVERVLARYLALPEPPRAAKPILVAALTPVVPARAGDFAQALMDLGATICAPRAAACAACPLTAGCAARRGDPLAFPIKTRRPTRPTRFGHAFVIADTADRVRLQRRPDTGLLAKMAETPGSHWIDLPHAPEFPLAGAWRGCGRIVHVFTHFRLELAVWAIVTPAPTPGWWVARENLDAVALPTVFRKALTLALQSADDSRIIVGEQD